MSQIGPFPRYVYRQKREKVICMRKKQLACVAVLCAILFNLTVAHATVTRAVVPKASLEFNGTTATCRVGITEAGKTIGVTMELWCGSAPVVIWTGRDTNKLDMSKTHTVRRGQTYTLKVFCSINNGETTKLPPITKTCP